MAGAASSGSDTGLASVSSGTNVDSNAQPNRPEGFANVPPAVGAGRAGVRDPVPGGGGDPGAETSRASFAPGVSDPVRGGGGDGNGGRGHAARSAGGRSVRASARRGARGGG